MGIKTVNDIFYKPDIGASGAVEKGKFDDGLDVADGFIEGNKPVNNKLSAFAATSSSELAGKISDEIGSGKLRFDTSVTIKTAASTLNVNEAGIILVACAAVPYPIELPTPIGNVGLRFKIKKTDYNYNLITFTTVAGKFDFVNDDGTLKNTYTRVNTPGAEVVFVADGANWQVTDEELGQVPECFAYLGTNQNNIIGNAFVEVNLDTESFDIGSNFDTTEHKFTAPVAGKYQILGYIKWVGTNVVADKNYIILFYKNGSSLFNVDSVSAATALWFSITANYPTSLSVNDYIELYTRYVGPGDDTQDISAGATSTFMYIKLMSKD